MREGVSRARPPQGQSMGVFRSSHFSMTLASPPSIPTFAPTHDTQACRMSTISPSLPPSGALPGSMRLSAAQTAP
jgi:hypothetical protein